MKSKIWLVGLLLCLCGCGRISVPEDYVNMLTTIRIKPDYREIKISGNASPLKFRILDEAEGYVTCISGSEKGSYVYDDRDVSVKDGEWEELLHKNRGNEIRIEIYLKKEGVWYKYPVIKNYVSDNSSESAQAL